MTLGSAVIGMDEQLFAHFVGKLHFAENTRLRVYHNGEEGDQSSGMPGEDWHSADEVRRKGVRFVGGAQVGFFAGGLVLNVYALES